MTGSRWSSAICEKPPNAPGVLHWTAGLAASGVALFTTLYSIAEKHIPVEHVATAEVEQMIVSLGAPAQRLEPPPPELIPDTPLEEPPPEPIVKTERAEEAPPPEAPPEPRYFPPVQQATGPLSSGFGVPADKPSAPAPPIELKREFIEISTRQYHQRITYPYAALKHHVQGTGRIRVEIDRSGKVLRWEMIQSTGSQILDREIKRASAQVKTLDPLPDYYPFPNAKLVIPFTFIME